MRIALGVLLSLGLMIVPAYAVNVSIDSSVQITNAPISLGSKWQVECGLSTGVYTVTKQFNISSAGTMTVPISAIFNGSGNFFCRTSFVQPYGQGPFSSEVAVTVTTPTLVAPSLIIVP